MAGGRACSQAGHGFGQIPHGQGLHAGGEGAARQREHGQAGQGQKKAGAGAARAKNKAGAQGDAIQPPLRSEGKQALFGLALGAGIGRAGGGAAAVYAQGGDVDDAPHAAGRAGFKQGAGRIRMQRLHGARAAVAQHAHGVDDGAGALQQGLPVAGVGSAGVVHSRGAAAAGGAHLPAGGPQGAGDVAANEAAGAAQQCKGRGSGCGGWSCGLGAHELASPSSGQHTAGAGTAPGGRRAASRAATCFHTLKAMKATLANTPPDTSSSPRRRACMG